MSDQQYLITFWNEIEPKSKTKQELIQKLAQFNGMTCTERLEFAGYVMEYIQCWPLGKDIPVHYAPDGLTGIPEHNNTAFIIIDNGLAGFTFHPIKGPWPPL